MPEPLQIDPETGFLTSVSPTQRTFTSEKKVKLFEIANEISRKQGIIPNINELCDLLNIDHTTFYRHLKTDQKFASEWQQVLLNVEAHLQSKMAEFAQRPSNYMDRITMLRRIAPERWNPEYKVTHQINVNLADKLLDKGSVDGYIDAEVEGEGNAA